MPSKLLPKMRPLVRGVARSSEKPEEEDIRLLSYSSWPMLPYLLLKFEDGDKVTYAGPWSTGAILSFFSSKRSTNMLLKESNCLMSLLTPPSGWDSEKGCVQPKPGGGTSAGFASTGVGGVVGSREVRRLRMADSRPLRGLASSPRTGSAAACCGTGPGAHLGAGTPPTQPTPSAGRHPTLAGIFCGPLPPPPCSFSLASATASSKSTRTFPFKTIGRYWSFRACVTARFSKCLKFSSKPCTCATHTLLILRLWKRWKRWSAKAARKFSASLGVHMLMKA
mmetsp:Transcript_30129/g.64121  ORF Transcript_30129/g.64121 Transcript_30129/m.64121 type:complete len:280 (+) Transcript_30129:123-962(+)